MVVEANSSDEAKQKVEAIERANSKSRQFTINFNGVRVI